MPSPVSRRLILQQAHGHPFYRTPIACKLRVSCSFSLPSRGSFHLSLAVLSTIGHTLVFSLTSWSRLIHTGFPLSRTTRDSPLGFQFLVTGLSPSLVEFSTPSPNFPPQLLVSHYPLLLREWFRLFPLRSPLLRESLLFSTPLATKMFQFTRFARDYENSPFLGLPHSDIFGSLSASDSPKLFAGCYVLPRLCVPRYPPLALICLTF